MSRPRHHRSDAEDARAVSASLRGGARRWVSRRGEVANRLTSTRGICPSSGSDHRRHRRHGLLRRGTSPLVRRCWSLLRPADHLALCRSSCEREKAVGDVLGRQVRRLERPGLRFGAFRRFRPVSGHLNLPTGGQRIARHRERSPRQLRGPPALWITRITAPWGSTPVTQSERRCTAHAPRPARASRFLSEATRSSAAR